jgi:hypothetical protein
MDSEKKERLKPCFHLAFFFFAAAAETQLSLPQFFDPYINIMTVSTSLPNHPAAAAKSCWPQLQNSFRSWTEKLAVAAAF